MSFSENDELEVSVIRSVTVRPCQPTKSEIITLSGLDRVSPAPLYNVFFYNAVEKKSVEESVIRALERVLVSWYPAAGRLRINDKSGKLEINCNDAGVVVYVATTDAKFEDLGYLSDYKPFYEKLIPKSACDVPVLSEKPLVVAQLTRFACGGLSIGFGGNHSLFDGVGAFNFLRAWSRICRQHQEEEETEIEEALMRPKHSRKNLLRRSADTDEEGGSHSIQHQLYSMPVQDLCAIPMKATAADDKSWETTLAHLADINRQGCLLRTFALQSETVEALILKAMANQESPRSFSTFDVLAAHIWRARVKALNIEPTTKICLQFPVDARNRLKAELGEQFSGNAFVLASTSCIAKELLEETLGSTAERVKRAKDAVQDDYITSYLKAVESSDKFFPSMRELTIISDWRKMPFQTLDFGWGRAACAAPLATPVPQTAYLMPSPHDNANSSNNKGVHIRLGLLSYQLSVFQFHLMNF